ncbi:hypothetical protein LOAG_01636 [Loa loa]|uniref:Uncharacterized protein n=1 Tax=Loa loa TaxID=7209 RepID=A0A1S0U971_LOALO|nr:hypothetical protein LOAG_01636 [Loa loa]EFO26854.1 hypothetical protein LOAG_01636 [Loa loa]
MSAPGGCEVRIHLILVSCSSFHGIILAQPPPEWRPRPRPPFRPRVAVSAVMNILLQNESFRRWIEDKILQSTKLVIELLIPTSPRRAPSLAFVDQKCQRSIEWERGE